MPISKALAFLLACSALAGCGGNTPVVLDKTSGPGHGPVSATTPTGGPGQPPLLSNGGGPVAGPTTTINVR